MFYAMYMTSLRFAAAWETSEQFVIDLLPITFRSVSAVGLERPRGSMAKTHEAEAKPHEAEAEAEATTHEAWGRGRGQVFWPRGRGQASRPKHPCGRTHTSAKK